MVNLGAKLCISFTSLSLRMMTLRQEVTHAHACTVVLKVFTAMLELVLLLDTILYREFTGSSVSGIVARQPRMIILKTIFIRFFVVC